MDSSSDSTNNDYNLTSHRGKVLQPLPGSGLSAPANPAADLIRSKLGAIYGDEPAAAEEEREVTSLTYRSKHQQFMYELSQSGKSLAEIQTEWHNYYVNLPDAEKHQVWQEFYATHEQTTLTAPAATAQPIPATVSASEQNPLLNDLSAEPTSAKVVAHQFETNQDQPTDRRSVSDIKDQLLKKVQTRTKGKHRDNLRSLLFGLSMGAIVLVILMFSFFNERIIAPFMTPSRAVSSTPLIIDPSTAAVGKDPKLIIPKINVEVPVVYDEPSIDEAAVQKALERGVVHYATTPNPGEKGNGVIFGHSSNNLFNAGKYKFAFVLLNKLQPGDTFYLEKDGKRYVYRIYERKIVPPTDVSVLNTTDKPATFTLITCDPPGTSLNRLVVIGEQISPDPSKNTASTATQDTSASQPEILPSNSPTLWSRFWGWLTH